MPTSTAGHLSEPSSGTRGSLRCTSISMTPSTCEPITESRIADSPSSSVSISILKPRSCAAVSADQTYGICTWLCGPCTMGSAMAITPLRPLRIERAPACGRYCSSSIACSTRCRVSGEIERAPLSTYDTVLRDTPASLATSTMVTATRASVRVVELIRCGGT